MQEYVAQINELKSAVAPTPGSLRSTLLDPAVNFVIQRMKKELEETKKKLEDTQNDLNAWKFTPDRFFITHFAYLTFKITIFQLFKNHNLFLLQ